MCVCVYLSGCVGLVVAGDNLQHHAPAGRLELLLHDPGVLTHLPSVHLHPARNTTTASPPVLSPHLYMLLLPCVAHDEGNYLNDPFESHGDGVIFGWDIKVAELCKLYQG